MIDRGLFIENPKVSSMEILETLRVFRGCLWRFPCRETDLIVFGIQKTEDHENNEDARHKIIAICLVKYSSTP